MELEVLKIWPDWKAVRLIGEGSFGKVYEIVRNNFSIEEHCALKVISIPSSVAELESMRSEGMDDEAIKTYYHGMVEEFVQEIAMMSKLKGNVNIVSHEDYAVVEHEGSIGWDILIRMELLTALPNHIRNTPLTEKDVINLSIDLCNALVTCQEHRIIHRDIKLDNIFLSKDGKYKLGDFGVARTIEKTISGLSKKGTYTYMAPEVYKSQPYGMNVDLYSLGIVMYKLLNNNREPFLPPHPQPITHTNKNEALVRRMSGEVIPAPLNANPFMKRIVLKACNYNSGNRYQTPMQMKLDLEAVKNSLATGTTPVLQIDHVNKAVTYTSAQSKNPKQPANVTSVRPTGGVATNSNRPVHYSVPVPVDSSPSYKTHIGTQPIAQPPRMADTYKNSYNGYKPNPTYNGTQGRPAVGTVNGTQGRPAVSTVNGTQGRPAVGTVNGTQGSTSKYSNKDIYQMMKARQPVDLSNKMAQQLMEFALKKAVPTYTSRKDLAKEIKRVGVMNVRNNIMNLDIDTLFLILKAVNLEMASGTKPENISVVVYNTYETLKRKLP